MIGIDLLDFEGKKYFCASLVFSYINELQDNLAVRFLYEIKNTIPLEVQYRNIKWGAKRIKKIVQNSENIITIGMSVDSEDSLAEVSFISTTGNEEKCIKLSQANMFFYCNQRLDVHIFRKIRQKNNRISQNLYA